MLAVLVDVGRMARSFSLMNFLRPLQKIWKSCFPERNLSQALDPICRYIFDKRHYSAENKRVKPGALLPDRNNETSIFFIRGLMDPEVWTHGVTHAANGRTLRARAEFGHHFVGKNKLVASRAEPPPLHGVITGWPADKDT